MSTRAGNSNDIDALVRYLRARLGDRVRSCVVYETDGPRVEFVRSDIPRADAQDRIERVRTLYEGERDVREAPSDEDGFGPLRASTHVFGGAIVVLLLTPDGSAVGFSLDHAVGGNLTGFVRDCLDVLRGEDAPPSE